MNIFLHNNNTRKNQGLKKNKIIYLTIDDGPDSFLTEHILSVLNEYNQKVTFFWNGYKAINLKHLIPKVIASGHKVGNHGYYHLNGWKTKRDLYILNALAFNDIYNSNLFRPPYGKITPAQWWHLKKYYKIIFWNYMAKDFKYTDPDKILYKVKQHTHHNSIIVLHENEKTNSILPLYFEKYLKWLTENNYQSSIIE